MLPKNVHAKHGAYYLVRNNKWVRLTDRLVDVPAALERVLEGKESSREEVAAYARRQLARSRANAKGRRGIEHDLTWTDIEAMLDASQWRCAVTGAPFSLRVVGPRKQRPYAPSIDRRDNDKGYVASNCRIVCAAANIAMNTWGEGVLLELARHMRSTRRILDGPLDLDQDVS